MCPLRPAVRADKKFNMAQIIQKRLRIIGVLLVVGISIFSLSVVSKKTRCSNINGVKIPNGINVLKCKTMINDNFLHSAKFMKIDHTTGFGNLLQIIKAPETFEDYTTNQNYNDFDAIWTIESINKALYLNVSKDQIERGYEIETSCRDNWLLVGKDNYSYYIEN